MTRRGARRLGDMAGPFTPLVALPADVDSTALWDSLIWASFQAKLFLEIIAIVVDFAASVTSIGCQMSELLTAALLLMAIFHVMKMAAISPCTKLIHRAASAAVGPLCPAPTLQVPIAVITGTADRGHAGVLLFFVIQAHYCGAGTHVLAAPLPETLLAALLTEFIQSGVTSLSMIIWARNIRDPLPAEAL